MKRLIQILPGLLALCMVAENLSARTAADFGNLPLWFEPAQGTQFIARGAKSEFTVSPSGVEFTLARARGESARGQLRLVGASPLATMAGENRLSGRINYLLGDNPAQWRTDIPTFSRVRVANVYPGINVVYYGNQQELEYDFNIAAGTNPAAINLRFDGAQHLSVGPAGKLIVQFKNGKVVQHPPVAYQDIDGQRRKISVGYRIVGPQKVGFALGNYDRSQPLVIDPVLTYSTYFGGNYGDIPTAIAVDPMDGSVYVAGATFSTLFTNNVPLATPGAFQTNYHGGSLTGDAFIARFDQTGTNLIYATYLGGSHNDGVMSMAVDAAGNAYLAGFTDSSDFPTNNALYGKISGTPNSSLADPYPVDAFVTELNSAGNGLVYSTYLGGSSMDTANGIAVDSAGNAYITGYSYSTDFPVTPNAFQTNLMCVPSLYYNCNAFLAEIAAGGTNLNYSSYLGGTNFDRGQAIAFNNGRVFVAGYTLSTNFPTTNSLEGFEYLNGSSNFTSTADGFVAAFASSVTNLTPLYSTLLGGLNYDAATGIAAAADGTAYVCGYTTSTNFPYTTTNVPCLTTAYVVTNTSGYVNATNGFLTQIKWDGSKPSIGYSAIFGGLGSDVASGVALDPAGNAYVVGYANSTDFPATTNNISGYLSATNSSQPNQGYSDAFIIAFNTNASALLYSAYLGGYLSDYGFAIAVDPLGNAYITGQTFSANFPTVNPWQPQLNGTSDMFIAKISQTATPFIPTLTISPSATGSSISLGWQMFPPDYDLESASNLFSGGWTAVSNPPVYSSGWYQVALPATNNIEFFRLHQH